MSTSDHMRERMMQAIRDAAIALASQGGKYVWIERDIEAIKTACDGLLSASAVARCQQLEDVMGRLTALELFQALYALGQKEPHETIGFRLMASRKRGAK